jgi:hypothetical protein
LKTKRLLSDGGSLDDVPLLDQNPEPEIQFPMWMKLAGLFLVSLVSSVVLLYFCDRVSTFYAWLIIIFSSGTVCFFVSLWAEDGKLKALSRRAALVCSGVCICSLVGFWILLM